MTEHKTFDIEKVSVIWNGLVVTGYAEGGEIRAERNEDDVLPKTGIKGDSVSALNANRSGVVTISLFNSSASLSQLRRDAQNRVEAPLTLRDANEDTGFIMQHDKCRILKVPPYTAKNDASSAEIKFFVPELNYTE